MSKLKILYTIPNFDTAGSGKVLYDLVKGLDKGIYEVEIACSSNRGAFFKEIESLGVPIHIVETTTPYRPYLTLLPRIRGIRKFIKENKFDIVHGIGAEIGPKFWQQDGQVQNGFIPKRL